MPLAVWFPPNKIKFSRLQIEQFILPEIETLRAGEYPTEPDEYYSYTKQGIRIKRTRSSSSYDKYNHDKKPLSPNGHFVIAAEIAAEVDKRISQIAQHRILEMYIAGMTPDEIAQVTNSTPHQTQRELNKMISYISGWRRKRVDFSTWRLLKVITRVNDESNHYSRFT